MALNLSVKIGRRVYVDKAFVLVTSSDSPQLAALKTSDGREIAVREDMMTEVFPGVRIGLGTKWQHGLASLLFDAPRSVSIQREDRYKRSGGAPTAG